MKLIDYIGIIVFFDFVCCAAPAKARATTSPFRKNCSKWNQRGWWWYWWQGEPALFFGLLRAVQFIISTFTCMYPLYEYILWFILFALREFLTGPMKKLDHLYTTWMLPVLPHIEFRKKEPRLEAIDRERERESKKWRLAATCYSIYYYYFLFCFLQRNPA